MMNNHCYCSAISDSFRVNEASKVMITQYVVGSSEECRRVYYYCTDHLGIISRNVVTLIEPRLGVIRWSILQACC